ncbi:MAG: UDP-N-acetylmuramoyl-L-alanyl-D-glutamate--2,6-diaminopimelate ligase [Oscillatoriales cyanobacterium SM2_1_8]|nr:UDP-N-acetylmuramoyl-L-alanyl-D-glutamate--2,6-diaminopimelate ligase [Oscillatoriales cyanobacterium SM2_1_8]
MKRYELGGKPVLLTELLEAAGIAAIAPAVPVLRVMTDSRQCQPGDVFVAMPGTRTDGVQFVAQALAAGAVAAVVPADRVADCGATGVLIPVPDGTIACAELAAAFYGHPGRSLRLFGVTGTNGKTTTAHLLEWLLAAEYKMGLLGTLYSRWGGKTWPASHTTPLALSLQSQLQQARAAGCEAIAMEVSSHALHQKRVWGLPFTAAVFTNLTQDHLDYHPTLEDYFQAKALLFEPRYLTGRAIVNADCPYGQRLLAWLQERGQGVWSYSVQGRADLWVEHLQYSETGVTGLLHGPGGTTRLRSPLVGSFNVANILGAVGAALHGGIALEDIALRLTEFARVPGRMERVPVDGDSDVTVVVDYAHTPDSLDNALRALRPFVRHRLVCVFGCGGDRDRTKRPLMGRIAATLADRVYVTSDNPRTEDPAAILQDIVADMNGGAPFTVEADRRASILQAIAEAAPGDTILIAGKGHEDYQILGTRKIPFDDRIEAAAALRCRQRDRPTG